MAKSYKLSDGKYLDSSSVVHNKKELKNILDDLFYQDGESFNPSYIITAGNLTGGKKAIQFAVPTDKSMKYINSITANVIKATIRHADSGYITTSTDLLTLGTITTLRKSSNNMIDVRIDLKTESSFANNCPIAVILESGTKFTFKK